MRAPLILLLVHLSSVVGLQFRSIKSVPAKILVERSPLPWRLGLEDVEPMKACRHRSTAILGELHGSLKHECGALVAQTTSDFVLVACPIHTYTHGLSVLDVVIRHLVPIPSPIMLVDAVPMFTCLTARVFRCCHSHSTSAEAWTARIDGTDVWLLFEPEPPGLLLVANAYRSSISRMQFTELQESFAIMLDARYGD